jgi:CheY-like chemotaxis protein
MSSGPLLIVEDNPHIRDVMTTVLLDAGYAVVEAADGEEGLALATLTHPDLILLDLNMPERNGFSFVEAVHEHGITAPILLVTADPRAEQVARDEQVAGYLSKPFDLEVLVETVAGLVNDPSP